MRKVLKTGVMLGRGEVWTFCKSPVHLEKQNEALVESIYSNDPEPYHTSALSGERLSMELLIGHLKHIHYNLSMH